MSKYTPLWQYIQKQNNDLFEISFETVEKVLGFPIDHSFLNCKKELLEYGYQVRKISLKRKAMMIEKADEEIK